MSFESYIWLSNWGTEFQPGDPPTILSSSITHSLLQCVSLCNLNSQCRTLNYDSSSLMCRLYEGALSTGNITQSVSTQCIGAVQFPSYLFSDYGQPCSKCIENRYLTCSNNGTCECPIRSCWNGVQCENRKNFSSSTSDNQSNWCTPVNTVAVAAFNIFWAFDGNTHDSNSNYTGISSGSISYVTSYLGTGYALHLNRLSSQYVYIPSGQLLFHSVSFTIETWIYPINFTTSDYAIFGQCEANVTNKCMFFIVRNYKLYCGFQNNDIAGATSLVMNRWSHVACVFNVAMQTQQVYLNGNIDGSRSSTAFQGLSGNTTIGVTYLTPPGSNYFNGYIDQMQFVSRAKNSSEILRDATLIAYYSFDNSSTTDNGPNGINTIAIGSPTIVAGRVNQALQFNSSNYISTNYSSFIMLGTSNQPHTFAVWVKPTNNYASSVIVFAYQSSWCLSFITMTSNGTIMSNSYNGSTMVASGLVLALNAWNHVGSTYSPSNGIKLYINGTLFSTSGAFNYSAAGNSVYVTIGSDQGIIGCTPLYGGGFRGALDEFYIYSRELTASDILALANP